MIERKVLVADDDPDIVELIEETLTDNNFIVLKADNGYSVLSKTKTEHPGVIILDIMMPRLDGYQTCQRLKESESTKNIPILIISGHIQKELLLKLMALGIKNYMAKPFNVDELLKRVETLYDNSTLQINKPENLKIDLKIMDNILTAKLKGELEERHIKYVIDKISTRITKDIKKIMFNISDLDFFGVDHINYLKTMRDYFSDKGIETKVSTGDSHNLRANLIKNSEISDMLSVY